MKPKTVAIIGAGGRGTLFADIIGEYGHLGKVVAVAEPKDDYRQSMATKHGVKKDMCFNTWQEFVARPKLCDAVVVATMDREHVEPAVACLNKGYDMLLEKPMAPSLAECRAIEQAQRKSGGIVAVCHSLRYHKEFRKVRDLVASGAIGRLITVDMVEGVATWHQAHSFVRGNWGNEAKSAFMLLAKCCHDIDYLCFLTGQPARYVSSFGSLTYFRKENAPEGAADRCTDNCPCEPTCQYSAIKQYVNSDRETWPPKVVSYDHSYEAHLKAIQTGPYGRCVWKCDNDVVDHQVVNIQFDNDITATFTMTAFTMECARRVRIHGTEGEIWFVPGCITVRTFADKGVNEIRLAPETGGHGGGDQRVVREWLTALHTRDDSKIVANAQESLRSHTVVFAAEEARKRNTLISLDEFSAS
ncbi:MAG: Gfo/Idh/MocA family oxidoreductase [Planctomycetes bacterium]|nr:Gfo/Idh/MocA family oxidoreductase [Planctomycetota bacterium]